MKSVLLTLLSLSLSLSVATTAFAECAPEQLDRLLQSGFSKEEIMQLCGAPKQPSNSEGFRTDALPLAAERGEDYLFGVWRVSQQSQHGSALEMWEITIQGDHLSVTTFSPDAVPGIPLPMDHRQQLRVQEARFDDGQFQVIFGRFQSALYRYDLKVINSERMEGTFSVEDTALSDLGILQGESGVLRDRGKVIMIKQR